LEHSPVFYSQLVRNCLLYQAPVDLLGHVKTHRRDGAKTVNLKECLKPIEVITRIYALKHKIRETGTVERLRRLLETGVITDKFFAEVVYVFDYLWKMRFCNQIVAHHDLKQVNDELNVAALTEAERANLGNVLSQITFFQEKLCTDFLGSPLYKTISE